MISNILFKILFIQYKISRGVHGLVGVGFKIKPPLDPIYFSLELHHLPPRMGIYIFDRDGFTSPMVGLVETTRYGQDIVDHGGAITSDGDLMILTEFG